MKSIFVRTMSLLLSCLLSSERDAVADNAGAPSFLSISTDSLTWAIDGYSIIGTYEVHKVPFIRFHLEAFGIDIPESLIDSYEPNYGEEWQRRIDGALMLSADYHPFKSVRGFHIGGGFNIQRSTVSRGGAETSQFATFEPIIRTGFQWYPFNQGLFITPYFVLGIPIHLSEPEAIGGERYEEAAILPVGSVQVGWRFPLRQTDEGDQ